MKKNIFLLLLASIAFISCNDWLNAPQLGSTDLDDFYTSAEAAVQNVTACYVPLQWEYNNTYYPEWFIGDVVSDDAMKGGQNTNDMAVVYDMENWKTAANNVYLLDFYRGQYQGIGRCNLALANIPEMETDTVFTQDLKDRLIGEAKYLRAYYYFRLLRVFGGVPKVDFIIDSDTKWQQPRASVEEIYNFILQDLEDAQYGLWLKDKYEPKDLGRVSKGAAQAMLMKANLYFGNFLENQGKDASEYYKRAKEWGDSIIKSAKYDLNPDYAENFTLAGENGIESVFEIQYTEDPTSDYGQGNGFTRGTFSIIMTRSRSQLLGGGWGFNKPSPNLYKEYEEGDIRRDVTILNPSDDLIENPSQEIYLGNRYLSRKYAMYNDDLTYYELTHPTRGPINNKQIRYADVLLMYAELCYKTGDNTNAIIYLNKIRERVNMGST